MTDYFNN
ncbi:hypothetical protein PUMCH_004055 [Australozyma saopauloensis]|nr:hypothetical protein PUMCH_004055 [[Candida] saopauloensis]